MRRLGLALLLLALSGLSGVASAAVRDDPPATTTVATTTTTTVVTTAPVAQVLPAGVTIAGIDVGGLTPTAALELLQSQFPQQLRLLAGGRKLVAERRALGATDYLRNAVLKAKTAVPGTDVPVATSVRGQAVRAYVAKLARRFDRKPVDASLELRHLRPFLTRSRPGFRLDAGAAVAVVVAALTDHATGVVRVPAHVVKPTFGHGSSSPVVIVRRGENRLFLYRGARLWRAFRVATGQPIYPTPIGKFEIVQMARNPWWYPPNSAWAAGESPVPPGPGNPLGTRWMGLSAPGVGIHGTPNAASLGYSASHGCVRMAIPEAEWLFDHVTVGTPVYIVPG